MSDAKRILDSIFEKYSEEQGFENVLLKYKILEILRFIQGPAVLDIGCGVGFLCKALSGNVERVFGLDGSPVKIQRAKEINAASNIVYVLGMFEEWKPDTLFNTVVATNVLEHVENVHDFLNLCRNALAPGGQIIVTVPNALGLHKRIGMHMGLINDFYALTEADVAKGHQRVYNRQSLENDLKKENFAIVYSGGLLLKPLSSKQMEAWDEGLVDALYEIGKELPDYCSSLIVVGKK
jgi:2-polyprenyl-3-methyl-5-hydroxy-6-metoxy-1,4-benzoquinol methylase